MSGEILHTLLKAFISVSVLFILTRLMGKKQISHLTFFDYVAGISIGSIAASFAVDPSVSYTGGFTALITYAAFPVLLSFIALKSFRARKLLDGTPSILVQNGRIIEKSLKKARLNVNDLLEECRSKNIFNIAEAEFVILETDGKISVLPKTQNRPLTPQDMGLILSYNGLCYNVIIDGNVMDENLELSGRDKEWLLNQLTVQGISDPKEILLGWIDSSGIFTAQRKGGDIPKNPLM